MASAHAPGGTLVLAGGGPFTDNDDLDRRLVAGRSGTVHVVPTADAYERPAEMVARAEEWGARIGVRVEGVMAMVRPDARREDLAEQVSTGDMVWLVGDSPIHLRTVMKDTPLWEAIVGVLGRGGLVVGVAGSAAALCDPMTDPRGGAFTFGLGLVSGLAVITETETWAPEQLHRTHALAGDSVVVDLPTGSALVRHAEAGGARWEVVGAAIVHGDLPT